MKREFGFEIPQNYCFHFGHLWAHREGSDEARVGVDKFATNLLGKIEHIDVRGADRWVRQRRKLVTISGDGSTRVQGSDIMAYRELTEESGSSSRWHAVRDILLYGVCGGLLIALLKLTEYR